MKKIILSIVIFTGMSSFMVAPSVKAGQIGEAILQTVNSSSFNYEANASVNLDKGGKMDLPFRITAEISEKGGKNDEVYGKSGSIHIAVKDISDLPRDWSDISFIDLLLKYNGSFNNETSTAYAEIESLKLNTDNQKLKEILNMIEELSKFITGKSFKISGKILLKRLEKVMGVNSLRKGEEKMMMSLFAKIQSVPDSISIISKMLDTMIDGGIIKVSRSTSRTSRKGAKYSLSLAKKITAEEAKTLSFGMYDAMDGIMPGSKSMMKDQLKSTDFKQMAEDISSGLNELGGSELSISFIVLNGKISHFDININLNKMGLPIVFTENVDFFYRNAYIAKIPKNNDNIIDINKVFNGVATIAEITTRQFSRVMPMSSKFNKDYSKLDESTDYNEVIIARDIEDAKWECGNDRACLKKASRKMMKNIRKLKRAGLITRVQYIKSVRELRKIMKRKARNRR